MQGIFRCQFSCPVLEQKLGDPNQVQIAKRQCDCYTLNSYQFKISIYWGTFSDCDLFRCHCHPSFLNISNCSAQRPSNRATFAEDLYFCMHRIELHSVTVIGCAQNKAKYCTRQCYCTSCTNTNILNAVSFYFECYEIVYASITLCPDCWIVTEKVTNIKIRCKARHFWHCTQAK